MQVLVGAHAVLATGGILAASGTASWHWQPSTIACPLLWSQVRAARLDARACSSSYSLQRRFIGSRSFAHSMCAASYGLLDHGKKNPAPVL